MKKYPLPSCLFLLLTLFTGRAAAAEEIVARPPLTPPQIEELVSPIALYPDPLVALILPAATFPSDIVLAARFLDRGGSPESVDAEPWDDSIRALTRYREVIDYLDENLEWTRRLGHCFMDQPDQVMDAIQMVRVRARTAGLLRDTSEQHVIVETDEICIVPAQPTVIYVPRYDPWLICRPTIPVYTRSVPFITFGVGWTVGSWLNFDCDWGARSVRIVHRPTYWYRSPNWDDRNRYRGFNHTNWTRRTSYPQHDNRFDRSPRVAGYQAPGRDHRDWSERNRTDHRSGGNYQPDFNRNPAGSQNFRNNRSNDWQNRRRGETETGRRNSASPVGDAVIPPVTTPMPTTPSPVPSYRRPDSRIPSGNERYRGTGNPIGNRGDRTQPSVRTVPSRPEVRPAPSTVNRTRNETRPAPETVSRARPETRVAPTPARPSNSDDRSQRRQNEADRSERSPQRARSFER